MERARLADSAFIAQLEINSTVEQFALDVRCTIAKLCDLDPQLIYPNDSTEDLRRTICRHFTLDWDYMQLVYMLEDDCGHILPDGVLPPPFGLRRFFFWRPPTLTLAEWIEEAARLFRLNPVSVANEETEAKGIEKRDITDIGEEGRNLG